MRHRTSSWLWVGSAALLLLLAFVGVVLARHKWDPRVFIVAGAKFQAAEHVGDSNTGYDGQFAYYIALDPLHARERLDAPAYRYQRILYPALAWLLSLGGRPVLVPWILIAINLAALTVAAGCLARMLAARGASSWHALALVLGMGALFALRADLNEPLALALSLLGVAALERRWLGWAALLFAMGGLAKESAVVFAAGAVCWLAWRRQWLAAVALAVSSVGPALAWGTGVTFWLGASPFQSPAARLEWWPLTGLRFVSGTALVLAVLWVLAPLCLLGILAVSDLRRPAVRPDVFLLLAQVIVVLHLPASTWMDWLAVERWALGLVAAGLLYAASHHRRLLPWLSALWLMSASQLFIAGLL